MGEIIPLDFRRAAEIAHEVGSPDIAGGWSGYPSVVVGEAILYGPAVSSDVRGDLVAGSPVAFLAADAIRVDCVEHRAQAVDDELDVAATVEVGVEEELDGVLSPDLGVARSALGD